MSRYDWERGTITLPPADYVRVRDAVLAEFNKLQSERYDQAVRAHARLSAARRTAPRHATFAALFDTMYGDSRDRYEISKAIFADPGRTKLRTPRKRDFPSATRATTTIHNEEWDGGVVFSHERRAITWAVSENNHAVERARESRIGRAFFRALDRVKWPSRGTSGGVIVGNDEYNTDSAEQGGGANYVTARYGPAGDRAAAYRPRTRRRPARR